jgi:hypothetical protein
MFGEVGEVVEGKTVMDGLAFAALGAGLEVGFGMHGWWGVIESFGWIWNATSIHCGYLIGWEDNKCWKFKLVISIV